jgi:hypothetical protein
MIPDEFFQDIPGVFKSYFPGFSRGISEGK